jgi:uncharacterized protein (DUF983 family)
MTSKQKTRAIPRALTNVLVVGAAVTAFWMLSKSFDYEFALWASLAVSVSATVLLSVLVGSLSKK